jgi:hypothetical protein
MSVFLSAFYFVPPNDRLAAMIFGNLRHDFGGVLPMSGLPKLLSDNLGDSEARLRLQVERQWRGYDAADCKVSTARLQ